jgi:AcrR family transcriptional regulator
MLFVCDRRRAQLMKTRQHILDATERTLQTKGLAGATTREIATAAGCAEATLFNHFHDKRALLLATMSERVPQFAAFLHEDWVGKRTVAENLEEIALAALELQLQTVPLLAALFADPELLALHQEHMSEGQHGPQKDYSEVAAYVKAEQGLGRIRGDIQPLAVASLLLGACFRYAFEYRFLNEAPFATAEQAYAHDIVQTLLKGLGVQAAHLEAGQE